MSKSGTLGTGGVDGEGGRGWIQDEAGLTDGLDVDCKSEKEKHMHILPDSGQS